MKFDTRKVFKVRVFKLYVVIYTEYFIFILLGCESSWCVGLPTLPLSYVNSLEILGAPTSLSPKALFRPAMEWDGSTAPM